MKPSACNKFYVLLAIFHLFFLKYYYHQLNRALLVLLLVNSHRSTSYLMGKKKLDRNRCKSVWCVLQLKHFDVNEIVFLILLVLLFTALLPSFLYLQRCAFGVGITSWKWLKKMELRVVVQHVVPLMTKKRLWGWQQTVKGCYITVQFIGLYYLLNCWVISPLSLLNRLVVERNLERKQKLQKSKPKAPEGRKHLSDVRIVQRNLVYIIGLPLNLTDEDVSGFIPLYIPFLLDCNLAEHGARYYLLLHLLFYICF